MFWCPLLFSPPLPLAVAVLIISLWHVPESRDDTRHGPVDWPGSLLATLGLGGMVYGLIESPRVGLTNHYVLIGLLGGLVALVLFVINEARVTNPMVPLKLFKSNDFAGANLLTLFLYAALSGTMFFFSLNLIQVQGYSATAAGAAFLPFVLLMFLLSRWSGGLVDRLGARLPLIVGPMIAATGFALFAIPGIGARYWTSFFPAVLVLGFGMSVSVAPLTTTVMGAVPEVQAGVASGINNAVSRTAGLLAIAVFGVVMLQAFAHTLHARLNELRIDDDTRRGVYEQRVKLGGIELPPNATGELRQAVSDSYMHGFRLIMLVSAGVGPSR